MMSPTHLYADFSAPPVQTHSISRMTDSEMEDLRLSSFEQGFSAGWEDAAAAHQTTSAQQNQEIHDALNAALLSVSQARIQLLDSLTPLFNEITQKLLPEVARRGIELHVLEHLKEMAASSLDQPIKIEALPPLAEQLRELLDGSEYETVTIAVNETLGELGVRICVDTQEREIDLTNLNSAISNALNSVMEHAKQENRNV